MAKSNVRSVNPTPHACGRGRFAIGAAAAALMLTLSTAAMAEEWEPDSHQEAVGADVFLFSAEGVGTTMPLIPFLHLELVDDLMLDARLPLGISVDGPGDETRLALGNPTVGARYAPQQGIIRWWVGGGLSLPMGAIDDNDIVLANTLSAIGMGGYDSHLFAQDALPVYITAGIDVRVHKMVSVQASVQPITLIPIDDRDDAEVYFQSSVGGEFRHDTGVSAGLDLKVVWFATENGDNAQVLIEPYAGYSGDVFFAKLGLLTALDEPLGFGFDRGGVASPHLTIGGKL